MKIFLVIQWWFRDRNKLIFLENPLELKEKGEGGVGAGVVSHVKVYFQRVVFVRS